MGCVTSHEHTSRQAIQQERQITKSLREHQKSLENQIRLLFLGTGESGKSTLMKQIQLLYSNGFTKQERERHKQQILSSILLHYKVLVRQNKDTFPLEENKAAQQILQFPFDGTITEKLCDVLRGAVDDPQLKELFEAKTDMSNTIRYFIQNNHFENVLRDDYQLSDQDIMNLRVRTTGIREVKLQISGADVFLIDVGGQRGERRKWINAFGDGQLTAIIFITSLADYDMCLEEDPSVNRMQESLILFEDLCQSHYFRNVPVLVFFNKIDVFRRKFDACELRKCFPHFKGQSVEEGLSLIQNEFFDCFSRSQVLPVNNFLNNNNNTDENKHHDNTSSNTKHKYFVTCALDTDNVRKVFVSIWEILVLQELSFL